MEPFGSVARNGASGRECFADGEERFYHFVKMSNEPPERGLRCIQLRVREQRRHSRAIREMHLDGYSVHSLSFCFVLLSVRFLPSAFSHGRTQFHTFGIVPLRALKNENRCLFSYGRTTTTVRTRRYGGADTSVRSQSPVLSTVGRGPTDAFSTLERVYLCK